MHSLCRYLPLLLIVLEVPTLTESGRIENVFITNRVRLMVVMVPKHGGGTIGGGWSHRIAPVVLQHLKAH